MCPCTPENWVSPTHQVDDVKQIAIRNGWHFIQMDKFAYNGEQYNVVLDYIKSNHLPCDYLWFVDSDECIEPANIELLLSEISLFEKNGIKSVRFHKRVEIVGDWRYFIYDVSAGNYSITMGDAVWLEREIFFDGNYFFKSPISYGITSVPLLHLHQYRKNAAGRVNKGIWYGGGMEVEIGSLQTLPETPYIRELKAKYPLYFETNFGCSYIGSSIYDKSDD